MRASIDQIDNFWRTRECESYGQAFDPRGRNWPFGRDLPQKLAELVGNGTVLDFGCGSGRFAGEFAPYKYTGIDMNQNALDLARIHHPNHSFQLASDKLPIVDTILVIEVLLHIHDTKIQKVVQSLADSAMNKILVLEVMDSSRRSASPYSWNRAETDYDRISRAAGLSQRVVDKLPIAGTEMQGTLVEWMKP